MQDYVQVRAPYDGELLGEETLMTNAGVEACLDMACQLFASPSARLLPYARRDILLRAAGLVTAQHEDLALLIASEGGKPLRDARIEVSRAAESLQWAAQQIGSLAGREVPMQLNPASVGRLAFTQRRPLGVVLAISAFNHPLNLIVHQVAPALAVGCPVLIKPALKTPLSCRRFMAILAEAGLPSAWCQMIVCADEVTAQLAKDPRLAFVSFIGSAAVGWQLRRHLAAGVHCALEHGGAAPVVVHADADLAACVASVLKGGFYHAGQVCVSVQRVFVQETIADDFSQQLAAAASKLCVGNPRQVATEVGPLITAAAVERVDAWVRDAEGLGGTILTGGKRIGRQCYAPTVIGRTPAAARISHDEVFGPVVAIYPYKDVSEALAAANALPFTFQAAVFGQDLNALFETAQGLAATAVMINDHTAFRVDWMPFGGRQQSGLGVGGIVASMQELSYEKMYVMNGMPQI